MVRLVEHFFHLDEVENGVGHPHLQLAVHFFLTIALGT